MSKCCESPRLPIVDYTDVLIKFYLLIFLQVLINIEEDGKKLIILYSLSLYYLRFLSFRYFRSFLKAHTFFDVSHVCHLRRPVLERSQRPGPFGNDSY